nr:hypothetical protein XZYIHYVE_XZYIHYVE_CDS_0002 [Microvirus sp.]
MTPLIQITNRLVLNGGLHFALSIVSNSLNPIGVISYEFFST